MANTLTLGTSKKRVQAAYNQTYKILYYSHDNDYPQRVRQSVARSSTTTACTDMFSTHLRGRGFKNSEIEKIVVNPKGQTLSQTHRMMCEDYAMYLGAAIHVKYDGLLNIIGFEIIPFDFVRLGCDDNNNTWNGKFRVYDDWACQVRRKIVTERIYTLDNYTTDKVKLAAMAEAAGGFQKWNGTLIYFTESGVIEYPTASCDDVFEDVETDYLIKVYKWRATKKGYMPGGSITYYGKYTEDEQELQTLNINESQGCENAHNIIVNFAETRDQKPDFDTFDTRQSDRTFELTEISVRENIIRSYGQDKALHSISTAGQLSNNKEIEEKQKLYDDRIAEERKYLSMVLLSLVSQLGVAVTEDDMTIVPITGIEKQKDNRTLAEQIGVGGLQSVQSIVESTTMTPEQKINYMVAIFGIEIETATSIVKGTPLPVV